MAGNNLTRVAEAMYGRWATVQEIFQWILNDGNKRLQWR